MKIACASCGHVEFPPVMTHDNNDMLLEKRGKHARMHVFRPLLNCTHVGFPHNLCEMHRCNGKKSGPGRRRRRTSHFNFCCILQQNQDSNIDGTIFNCDGIFCWDCQGSSYLHRCIDTLYPCGSCKYDWEIRWLFCITPTVNADDFSTWSKTISKPYSSSLP